jgi:type IV secretion system protein VirD4
MVLTLNPEDRNLVTVRQMLTFTHPMVRHWKERLNLSEEAALIAMMESIGERFGGVVQGQGAALKNMADKERQSVLSEARTQTQFLDSKLLQRTLLKSDFRLGDLKRERLSVFLCLPARYMDSQDRWLRVIINLAIGALEPKGFAGAADRSGAVPVLLLLEEFPVLKHMEKLETAAGLLAGAGVRL